MLTRLKKWFNATGKPVTQGYEHGASGLIYSNWHRRPPWSYWYADLMLLDPQVWFGLMIGNGPLMSAKIKVKCKSPEVKKFVEEQWNRIWTKCATQILRTKQYGFLAFEVICKEIDGQIEFDYLRDFHPVDVAQLKDRKTGARAGVRVRQIRVGREGYIDLIGPKGLWLIYDQEFSRSWGRALLERCYRPWFDKNSDGGALDLRRLHGYKDAWFGDMIKYPDKMFNDPNHGRVHGRDLAREIGENRASGGVVYLPSTVNKEGKPEWEYQPPATTGGETAIPAWIADLDWEILDGLLVPKEVVEAGGSGGGWSGRSVPWVGFLAVRDQEFAGYVRSITAQLLKPLALVRFGRGGDDFDVEPVPLVETMGEQVGEMGKPELTKPQPAGSGPPQQPKPEVAPGDEENGRPQQFSTAHAPAGGITIGGDDFTGGEFIPGKVLAKATAKEKKEKAELAGEKPAGKPARKAAAPSGGMQAAKRIGKGKEAKLVLSDGSEAPAHIKPSMVPPQWTDVHVSTEKDADVLVRARDAKGRIKTVYSDNFTMRQAALKFARVSELVAKHDKIAKQNQANRRSDDPKIREAADCLWLIDEQGTRPGSDSDTKAKVKAYGATTLRAGHVELDEDGSVRLHFIGKEGIEHNHRVRNHELAAMLVDRKKTADNRAGKLFDTSDTALRDYTRSLDGGAFTPKDFRTSRATLLAKNAIEDLGGCCRDKKEYKAAVKQVATTVSSVLGNRPQQAIESYINPTVWSAWRCPDCA